LHYGKKLVRLLLDFGVVNTMDDSCEQQVPSTSLCSQQLTHWQRDDRCARFSTAVVWCQVELEAIL